MTLDPIFIATNQIYETRTAPAMQKRLGRRLREDESNQAWIDAAEIARQEAAQQQQIDVLGAEVDRDYAPMVQREQAHEAATIDAIEDLRRGAKELAEAQAAREIEFADQHDDWRDWQWSQGDLGL